MIIEFVGPSGAGKTFISQRLKDYLQANMSKPKKIIFGNKKEIDTCFNSTVERILFNLLFILKLLTDRNFLSLLFLRINAKGKKFFSLKYIVRMFVRYCRVAEILNNNKGDNPIFIVDEGFIARCGHMFKNKPNEELEDYLELMGKVNGIKKLSYAVLRKVYVLVNCADYDEIINRVLERGKTSLYLRLPGDGRAFHAQELKSFELAREYLDQIRADYVVIDNSIKRGDYTAQFAKIKELIANGI